MLETIGKIDRRKEDQSRDQFERLRDIILNIKPRVVLDIGCGLAYIDVLIAQAVPLQHIHLVDGDGTVPQVAGYRPDTKAWNDVTLGVEMVRLNTDVPVTGHHDVPKKINVKSDLIISCRSWGHHYPIDVYLATVDRCLMPDGYVITDIRNKTDGLARLKTIGLEPVQQISDPSLKCTRWLLTR